MSQTVYLVQGDTARKVYFSLLDPDAGNRKDPTTWGLVPFASDLSIRLIVRPKGATTAVLTRVLPHAATPGEYVWDFAIEPGGVMLEPGHYEGEVELTEGGFIYTLYTLVPIVVRAKTSY